MPQLTLQERTDLAANEGFRARLATAIKKTANYWKDQVPANVAGFNAAMQKRKRYAQRILNAPDMYNITPVYADYFVKTQYNEDIDSANANNNSPAGAGNRKQTPGDAFNANTNQLSDFELTDSSASAQTFDYFAGVTPNDANETIEW